MCAFENPGLGASKERRREHFAEVAKAPIYPDKAPADILEQVPAYVRQMKPRHWPKKWRSLVAK